MSVDPAAAEGDERFSFTALAESIDDPVVIWSPLRDDCNEIIDFVYEYVNAAAERTIGISAAELIGQQLLVILPVHIELGLFDRYRTVATTGTTDVIDIPWFEDGNVAGAFQAAVSRMGDFIVSVARNMTEHVLTEHRLMESERRTRMLPVGHSIRSRINR